MSTPFHTVPWLEMTAVASGPPLERLSTSGGHRPDIVWIEEPCSVADTTGRMGSVR
jgi:hypothetical protein